MERKIYKCDSNNANLNGFEKYTCKQKNIEKILRKQKSTDMKCLKAELSY